MAPGVLERFYREARIAATFDHPNLCPVYAVDQVDGVHYLTMPLLDGQPLSKCLEGRHPCPSGPSRPWSACWPWPWRRPTAVGSSTAISSPRTSWPTGIARW